MGQEQSVVDASTVPGFNPDGRPSRPKAKGKAQGKRTVKAVTAQQHNYFVHTDIKDHITPIYEEDQRKKRQREEGDLAEDVDINKLLAEFQKGKEDDDEDDLELRDLPGGLESDGSSSSSDEDDDGAERGKFHHEVQRKDADATAPVTSAAAHPVAIEGEVAVGNILAFQDMSTWRNTFPVHKIEWFLSSELGVQNRFAPFPANTAKSFRIPEEAVGKYILLQVTRRVEDQLHATHFRHKEGGVFDAHIDSQARHTDQGVERKFVDVKSTSIAGPVLVSDEWAHSILQSLAEGSVSVAVKLRDEPLDPQNEYSESGAREKTRKIPGLFKLTFESAEIQYEQPKRSKKTQQKSALFAGDWLSKLVGLVGLGSPDSDEVDQAAAESGMGKVREGQPVKFIAALNTVQFRPSVSASTMVLASQLRKVGYSHKTKTQDLIRIDVDPKLGRDLLLFTIYAFQAVVDRGDVRPATWREFLSRGELGVGKNLLQKQLETMTAKTSETEVALEEMPETPWDY